MGTGTRTPVRPGVLSAAGNRLAIALAAVALLLAAAPSAAWARTPVDPSLMQPPLNPTFTWSCWQAASGQNIVCDGQRHLEWSGEPTGLFCGADDIHTTGTDDQRLRRTGDAQGRALRSHLVADVRETLALDPQMTGPIATLLGRWNASFDYEPAGDAAGRVETVRGNDITVVAAGTGRVFHDVGIKAFDSTGEVLFARGQHQVLEDFDGTFVTVCDALRD